MKKILIKTIALTAIGVVVKAKSDKLYKDLDEMKMEINALEQTVDGIEYSLNN